MKPCRKMKKTLRTNALLRGWAQHEVLLRRLPRSTLPAAWKGSVPRRQHPGPPLKTATQQEVRPPLKQEPPLTQPPTGPAQPPLLRAEPLPSTQLPPRPTHPPPRPQEQLPMNLLLQAYPHPQVPFLGNNLKQGWSHFCFKIHSYIYTQENAGKNTLRH